MMTGHGVFLARWEGLLPSRRRMPFRSQTAHVGGVDRTCLAERAGRGPGSLRLLAALAER